MPVKIEPKSPYDMGYGEVKEELIMRLHDAGLIYQADQYHKVAEVFFKAEKLVKDADFDEARKACSDGLGELRGVNPDSSLRIHALFNYLQNQKKNPANGSLALATTDQIELIQVEVVDEFGMSEAQIDRLNQLEFAIQKGIEGFKAAGEALREIRDAELYKQYGTFEEYCETKWGFSRSRAYQYIEAEKTVNNLLTSGIEPDELPENEAQARALAAVPPERQAEVWSKARSEGKPSAAKIKAIASGGSALPPSHSPKGGEGGKSSPDELWNPNLWETPDNIAKAIASLLVDGLSILEPCAGTGQIAKAIVSLLEEYELTAIEILKDRAAKLEDNRYFSIDADFLEFDFGSETFDVVVTNPPFDKGLEILEKSLSLLKISGRCLFLLPIAYFQTQERAKQFAGMGAYIHRVYPIVGRVAYLKNGIPESGRQCEDAIFDVRRGKSLNGVEFIWQ